MLHNGVYNTTNTAHKLIPVVKWWQKLLHTQKLKPHILNC